MIERAPASTHSRLHTTIACGEHNTIGVALVAELLGESIPASRCGEMVGPRQLDDVLFHEDHIHKPAMKSLLFIFASLLAFTVFSDAADSQWGSYPNRPLLFQHFVPPDGRLFSLAHDVNYIDQAVLSWASP